MEKSKQNKAKKQSFQSVVKKLTGFFSKKKKTPDTIEIKKNQEKTLPEQEKNIVQTENKKNPFEFVKENEQVDKTNKEDKNEKKEVKTKEKEIKEKEENKFKVSKSATGFLGNLFNKNEQVDKASKEDKNEKKEVKTKEEEIKEKEQEIEEKEKEQKVEEKEEIVSKEFSQETLKNEKTQTEKIENQEIKKKEENKFKVSKSATGFLGNLFNKKENNNKQIDKTSNLFVKLFPQDTKSKQETPEKQEDTLIETIVEQSEKKKSILGQKLHSQITTDKPQEQPKKDSNNDLFFWSQISIVIAFIIPFCVYLFFYFQLATDNRILEFLGKENLGMQYEKQQQILVDLETSIKSKKTAIKTIIASENNNIYENAISNLKLVQKNWLEVIDNIKEVTNEGIKYNDKLKRLVYKSYAFDGEKNTINLSGTLFDPNKQVFTLMIYLIEAINESEYFDGLEMRNFSKSINEDGATMSVNVSFNYIPSYLQTSSTTVLNK